MISVCVATYNGEKYIFEQLQSILSQIGNNDEIIISDDGSVDKTIEIISGINDKRIKFFKNEISKGIIRNIENALNKSIGEIIFLSDQDDIWLPNKVRTCVELLEKYHLVVSDCYITDENLNIVHDSFFKLNKSKSNKWWMFIKNPYLGCCMAFRRTVLNTALPFPKKIPMHDSWIGSIASFKFNTYFAEDKLIFYRRHESNASTTSEPTKAKLLTKISYRINSIYPLFKRLTFKK